MSRSRSRSRRVGAVGVESGPEAGGVGQGTGGVGVRGVKSFIGRLPSMPSKAHIGRVRDEPLQLEVLMSILQNPA